MNSIYIRRNSVSRFYKATKSYLIDYTFKSMSACPSKLDIVFIGIVKAECN